MPPKIAFDGAAGGAAMFGAPINPAQSAKSALLIMRGTT